MTIETVGTDVERAVGKPPRVGRHPLETLRKRRDPFKLARALHPERLRITSRSLIDPRVADGRRGAKRFGRWEDAIFPEQCVNLGRDVRLRIGHDGKYTDRRSATTGLGRAAGVPAESFEAWALEFERRRRRFNLRRVDAMRAFCRAFSERPVADQVDQTREAT